jgi:predicted dehydrogenase
MNDEGLNGSARGRRFQTVRRPSVAVVGLGYWGPNLLRVLVERTDIDVRWMCDADPARLERLARRYPNVSPTLDLDDVLEDPEVDGVLLATPVFTHYELARRCLEADKHTLVEKPLAASGADAAALINLATERELVLMCGHTFLFSPPVRAVRKLIDDGELGELYFVSSSRVNLGLHQRDVSVVWDLGPHDFSILRGIADVAFVTMEFPSGVIANVELSWLAPSKLRRTVIVGSKKMIVYEDGAAEAVRIFDRGVVYKDPETFGEYHLSYRTGDILSPQLSSDEPLALQTEEFVRLLRGGGTPLHCLALASDVVRLAEAAEASIGLGGSPIEVGEGEFAHLVS